MKLLTKAIRAKLIKQGVEGADNQKPVVKFYNPCGSGTWLFSELNADGDTLYGLADMGYPELGYSSLSEIEGTRLRFGLKIERDLHFTPTKSLEEYAEEARRTGSISA
jgi:hypothetical protein|tara:strand:- start:314 stop:637 length:324 start_codon:yes stop_codon:yes gene_type:complete